MTLFCVFFTYSITLVSVPKIGMMVSHPRLDARQTKSVLILLFTRRVIRQDTDEPFYFISRKEKKHLFCHH